MNILVFLKSVNDVRIPVEYDSSTGTVKKDWNVPVLDPGDRAAIDAALELKAALPETRITLVHLGPAEGEQMLRDGLALGCDEGLRVRDDGLEGLHTPAKAIILARVARILTFDLLFVGAKSQDTGSSQLGILLASSLGLPCVTRVIGLRSESGGVIVSTKRRAGGYQELIESHMPLVVTMEISEGPRRYASLPPFLAAVSERKMDCVSLSEIGIPLYLLDETESRLSFGRLRFPVSRFKSVPAPDSSLPAFERREKLREGSMKKRAGVIVKGKADDVAEELFQTLLKNGWLDHMRKVEG